MSGYTPELREIIKRAEATRSSRVEKARRGEHYPALTMEERAEYLKKYHPDYKSEGRRKVAVGPNRGSVMPEEVARVLESRSRLNAASVDLSKADYSTALLVIGAGGAGTAAALAAEEAGQKGLISTKLRHGDSNTVMAEGGIQAAGQAGDSPS